MKAIVRAVVVGTFILSGAALGAAGPVEVRSDGVTLEAREAMMKTTRDYNLHLAFVQQDSSFLAGVNVTLHDSKGGVVWSGVAEGPLLFARVPPGSYVVTATSEGQTLKRTVKTAERGPLNYLRWPGTR